MTAADTGGVRAARFAAVHHVAAIQALAQDLQRPPEEVAAVYQCELLRLAAGATVTDFLPVLVAKRVRRMYQHRLDLSCQADPCARLIPRY
jgi:hypothetical protein